MVNDCVETLSNAAGDFVAALRQGYGVEEERLRNLCNALDACRVEWKGSKLLPRTGVNILVTLFPAIESCQYLYLGDEAKKVLKVGFEIQSLVEAVVALESEAEMDLD